MRSSPGNKGKSASWGALLLLVALCLALSFVIAAAASTFVPVEAGTVELPRDYRSYSREELREVLSAELPQSERLVDSLRDRGILFQAVIWALAAFFVRFRALAVFLFLSFGLILGLLVGLFSLTQFSILLASVIGTLAIKDLVLRSRGNQIGGI